MSKKQNTSSKKYHQIIIIGGGPAGMAAAIQLARCGLDSLLVERREPGGLLWNANLVENYPGFPNGVSGAKLIGLMVKQMERVGVEMAREEVENVSWEDGDFIVETKNEKRKTKNVKRKAAYLVVASGTQSRPLPNVIAPEARDRVFTEVWPLAEVSGKHIVIIGAGDAAFDYALNLSKNRNNVTILNRGETVKCLPLLFERAAREMGIAYRAGIAVSGVNLNETADRLEVRWDAGRLEADFVLFAIGRVSNRSFLSESVRQNEEKLIEAGRLYFVGDVKNESYRQVAIAAGDGLRAAMEIYTRINHENSGKNG